MACVNRETAEFSWLLFILFALDYVANEKNFSHYIHLPTEGAIFIHISSFLLLEGQLHGRVGLGKCLKTGIDDKRRQNGEKH